jgi:hypothetical protein
VAAADRRRAARGGPRERRGPPVRVGLRAGDPPDRLTPLATRAAARGEDPPFGALAARCRLPAPPGRPVEALAASVAAGVRTFVGRFAAARPPA